jgi:hypothetical protein
MHSLSHVCIDFAAETPASDVILQRVRTPPTISVYDRKWVIFDRRDTFGGNRDPIWLTPSARSEETAFVGDLRFSIETRQKSKAVVVGRHRNLHADEAIGQWPSCC